jgi:hypothetical protein
MARVVKITASMFPDLYAALLEDWNPGVSRAQWQQAFEPRWDCSDDHYGYALLHDGRIVGMLGMLFSRRVHAGREVRFCNVHAWRVLPEHRSGSLLLMRPALAMTDHVVTDFSPSPAVGVIARRLGFRPLDATVWLLPPLPPVRLPTRASIVDLPDGEPAPLDPAGRRICADHAGLGCGQLLASIGSRHCHVVFSTIRGNGPAYCFVHHIGDADVFCELQAALRAHLLRRAGARFVVVEARHLRDRRVPLALRVDALEKLYRGQLVPPAAIDTLYSEVVLFRHPQLPTLRRRLREALRRLRPATAGTPR